MKTWIGSGLLGLMGMFSAAAGAQSSLPPELQGWQGWVLEGEAARQCALKAGADGRALTDYQCTAATELALSPNAEGLTFSVRVKTDRPTAVPLPGEPNHWPRQIRVNGQPATLRHTDGQWWVALPAGEHQIQGQWDHSFDRITMPALFARVVLQPDHRPLRRDGNHVWLNAQPPASATEDTDAPPSIQVWRQLTDGQAVRLTTQVSLRLSSAQRLTLGPALPAGFVPVSWDSTVPAVVTPQGELVIQAGRGTHTITIEAQCTQACLPTANGQVPPAVLALSAPQGGWPAQETWSVVGAPAFRQLSMDGEGVDPAAAHVPEAWREAPAYRVSADQPLALKASSRGRQPGEGEQLTLARETWWTDEGWINWDRLTGTLPVGARLAMQKPYQLGRVESQGTPLPLSIDGAGNVGLEWGTPEVEAWAQSSQPHGRTPTTGWNATLEQMTVTMHLPPGTALIAAPGTTGGNGAWLDRFTLLSFFGIALLALLVRQALGNVAAVVAGLTAAGWVGQGGALLLLWLLAIATAFHLMAQAIPAGRLQTVTAVIRSGTWALLALAWIPFAGDQARMAMHPQLTPAHYTAHPDAPADSAVYDTIGDGADHSELAAAEALPPLPAPAAPQAERAQSMASPINMVNAVNANDPLAGIGLAQVGQPLPTWHTQGQGRHYTLTYPGPLRPMNLENSYAGPGAAGMQRVWIAPTWAVQFLRVLGTLAVAWLALRLLGQVLGHWTHRLPPVSTRWARRLGLALLLMPLLASAQDTDASATKPALLSVSTTPDAATLAELKRRLTQPPACAPDCVALVGADLEATGEAVVVSYRVSAEHAAAWALPVVNGATLTQVLVDGQPAWFASERTVVLDAGQSRIVAHYRPQEDRVSIDFPQPPLDTTERLTGWTRQGTLQGGSWSLERASTAAVAQAGDDLPPPALAPAFANVTRELTLGATPVVVTTATRLPGSAAALTLHLPAITGESVESDKVTREGEAWVVTLPAGQATLSWTSRLALPPTGTIALTALPAQEGVETWHVIKGPAWTLTLEGIPESMPARTEQGLVRQLLPLAGETLTLHAARLPAAPGEKQRIDAVSLETQAGPHDATHVLAFTVTTAQAGERTLTFPDNSEVINISVAGQRLSLPLSNNRLALPLSRGEQAVRIEFRTPSSLARLTTPQVDLGGPASNVRYQLGHTERRWVLLTWGPGWGTAVLYWSQLAVLLLVAYGLAKLPHRLFSLPVALLLVLGFSTLPGTVVWLAALVAWQFWVSWRARLVEGQVPAQFNLQQLALAAFTGLTVLALTGAIAFGLLGAQPDMMIRAPMGLSIMEWLVPHTATGPLAGPTVVSLPMWVYQALLFAWALWFAAWLIHAIKQALAAWLHLGYWRKPVPAIPPLPPQPAPSSEPPPAKPVD